MPGRTALLYEVRPEAGFVLGLDIGLRYLRGAVADLAGEVRARLSVPVRAATVGDRVAELVELADELCARAGIDPRPRSPRRSSAARASTTRSGT